jgi:hypothetical protein
MCERIFAHGTILKAEIVLPVSFDTKNNKNYKNQQKQYNTVDKNSKNGIIYLFI